MNLGNAVLIADQTGQLRIWQMALKKFVHAVLKKLRYKKMTVSIVFVSDAKIKRLNQKHLGHSYPTDVLAFPSPPPFLPRRGGGNTPRFLGEVIISPQRARIQAKRFGASFEEELMRYVCHGILHLSGYSDKTKRETDQMRKMEDRLLKLLPRKKRV